MKTILSGVTRKERLDILLNANVTSLLLDFSLAKTLSNQELLDLRERVDFLGLDYDLSHKFSRVSSLWGDSPSVKLVEKHGCVESAQQNTLLKFDGDVEKYAEWWKSAPIQFDVLVIPRLPIQHNSSWTELLKSNYSMFTVTDLDQLDSAITNYTYIAFEPITLERGGLDKIRASTAILRSFSTKTHVWGRVNKETALSGSFWSASTSNWISGSRYGNTYDYVGNLKLVQHHATKGLGKSKVRSSLKSKCLALDIDHSLLMSDDRYTVDLWNAHQFVKFGKDTEKLKGYWSPRDKKDLVPTTTKPLAVSTSVVGYSRTCNSCYVSAQCPLFEPDSVCKLPPAPQVQSPDDVEGLLNQIIQIQGDRVLFSAFAEKVQNAGINPEVSRELETLTRLMKDAKEIVSPSGGDEVMIRAKGSGIINRLFGGYGKSGGSTKPSMSEKIIDVSPIEDDDE